MTYNEDEIKELFDVVFKLSAKDVNDKLIKVRNRPEIAKRRWFWELLQNAKDAVKPDEKVSVRLIIGSENGKAFADFQHNGNPFRYQDAKNLIFPYSDKADEENSDKSGRFGTGFLATHILSKKIEVKGVYLNEEKNQAFNFNFILDRSGENKPDIAASINKTWQEFRTNSSIFSNYQYNSSNFETSFKYELDDDSSNLAIQSIKDFNVSLPFALAFIPKIKSVEILNHQSNHAITYHKIDQGTEQLTENIKQISVEKKINENGQSTTEVINLIICSDNVVDIAIETYQLNGKTFIKEFAEHQPLLFCPFPLIGPNDFKFPLVINSVSFIPKEERDGIWLADTIEGKANQNLFERVLPLFNSVVTFASNQNWQDTYLLFKSLKNELVISDFNSNWFKDIIHKPIKEFIKQIPLVDTNNGERLAISTKNQNVYFSSTFDENNRLQLWDFMVALFPANIPLKNQTTNWYNVIWDDCPKYSVTTFTKLISTYNSVQNLETALSKTREETLNWLNDLVAFVNTVIPESLNNNESKILPNQFGIFKKKDELFLDDGTIDKQLKEILADISKLTSKVYDWRSDMLDKVIIFELPAARTKTLALIGATISDLVKDLLREEYHSNEHRNVFSRLLNWLNENPYKAKDHFKGIRIETLLYKTANASKIKHITDLLQKDRNGQLSVEDLSNIDATKIALLKDPDLELKIRLGEEALAALQKEKVDFQHKHEIGTYIESLIRERLAKELQNRVSFGNKGTEATNIQGGQDIVILLDENPVYFIEVKSRWNSQNSVSMSKLQLQRAVEENEQYALCAVDITRYTGTNDKYKLSIDEVLSLTKFVTKIGDTIRPLIEGNLEAEKQQDESIHLVDYRGVIPQEIIQRGSNFDNFIELLCQTIIKTIENKKIE